MAIPSFDDSTDYAAVDLENKQEYSQRVADSCDCSGGSGNLCDIAVVMYGGDINLELGDIPRWKEAVEAAYKLLFF